ncbi:MAG: bifunctional DNA-formamidopyrimidine glycosylase/DNA-(apurinic or apyrimidinic site) lyase, partial [Gemmatimonadota bacterium]
MPELPEVETIRRDLAPELEGRRITAVRLFHDDIILGDLTPEAFRSSVEGRRVLCVDRRAKWLLIRLDDRVLVTQLRMTGRFAVGRGNVPPVEDFRHLAAEFDLDDGRTLFYDDMRRLGGFLLLTAEEWVREESRFGPEPLSRRFRASDLGQALRKGRGPVKNALMDQTRVAGIGNIYASEALHRARIDPARPTGELTEEEIRRLHRSVRHVLRASLDSSGTTFSDYRAVNGRSGSFQTLLRVYG